MYKLGSVAKVLGYSLRSIHGLLRLTPYSIGFRLSEDIDVAIAEAWTLSGNQLKNLIKKTARNMTEGLEEFDVPNKTSKGSHYHKAFYHYPQITESQTASSINPGQLLVEINSFANPYPVIKCKMESYERALKDGIEMLGDYSDDSYCIIYDKEQAHDHPDACSLFHLQLPFPKEYERELDELVKFVKAY